jgi:uncharacterized membrane protein YhaH (DUF805 family)
MNFIDVPGRVLSKYFVFEGRASRSEYWWWFLITFVIGIVAGFINPGLPLIILIFLGIPTIALNARRLHDLNRSGWLQLIGLIPFIGWVLLPIILIPEGTHGPNTYGEDPVERSGNRSRPTRRSPQSVPTPQQRSSEPAPSSRDTTPNPPPRSPAPIRSSGVLARNATVRLAMYVAATDGQLSQAKGVIVRDWALDRVDVGITDDKEHLNDVIRTAFEEVKSGNLVLGHLTDTIRKEGDSDTVAAAVRLVETIVEADGPASDEESRLVEQIRTQLHEPMVQRAPAAEPPTPDTSVPEPKPDNRQELFNELRVRNLHHVMDLLENSFTGQHPTHYEYFAEASKRILLLEPFEQDWAQHVALLGSLEASIHVFSRHIQVNEEWQALWNPPSVVKAEKVIVAIGSSFHAELFINAPDRVGMVDGICGGWASLFNFDQQDEEILHDEIAGYLRALETPLVVISDNPTIFDLLNSSDESEEDAKFNFRKLAFIHNRVMLALGGPGEPLSEATLDSSGITLYGPSGTADVMDLLPISATLEGSWQAARDIVETMPR